LGSFGAGFWANVAFVLKNNARTQDRKAVTKQGWPEKIFGPAETQGVEALKWAV
jgi:hypothetical protein